MKFETLPSLLQELTFESAKNTFKKCGVAFNKEKYLVLKLKKETDACFTNLALLLSDQCPFTIKVAVFSDDACTEFRDSKEFGGSVLRQFEDTMNYLLLCNKTKSTIRGAFRQDAKDYPDEAIREALLNAIIHRDYSYSGSIIINVTDKKLEIISIGGLLNGLSKEDICLGISQQRNPNLAEIFHRLRLIESYGTGIRRIFKLYEGTVKQPELSITPNAFRIELSNQNETLSAKTLCDKPLTYQMEHVVTYIRENGPATDADIEKLLEIKHTRAYNLTRAMSEMGIISAHGRGKTKTYSLTSDAAASPR